eukprot:3266510-Rhodomonas_salina.1
MSTIVTSIPTCEVRSGHGILWFRDSSGSEQTWSTLFADGEESDGGGLVLQLDLPPDDRLRHRVPAPVPHDTATISIWHRTSQQK